jgi:hypothetical protein
MGAFITAVHAKTGTGHNPESLTSAIAELMAKSGFDVVDDGEADRTVVIVGPGADGWISIYDEGTEGQDERELVALAQLASKVTGAPAITVLVHDSDVLQLGLFESGRRKDAINTFPGYFGERAPDPKKTRGQPKRWQKLLTPGSIDALSKVLAEEKLFAERTLADVAELIGLPIQRATVGYNYLREVDTAEWPSMCRLRFRLRERPPWEQRATGPTVLASRGYGAVAHDFAVGDQLRVGATAHNRGGASTGLDIIAFGDAIARGLVAVDRFELLIGPPQHNRHRLLQATETTSADGARMFMATLEDAALPAGVVGDMSTLHAAAHGHDFRRVLEAMNAGQVHVNVVGRVLRPGEGDLDVALVPRAHREGEDVSTYPLRIAAPLFRPLRASANAQSHILKPLTEGRTTFAMILFPSRSAAAVAHAESALRTLVALCAPPSLTHTTFFRDAERRPRTATVRTEGFFASATWKKLVEAMTSENVVDVATDQAGGAMRRHVGFGTPAAVGCGMTFGSTLIAHEGLELVTGLGVWLDTKEDRSEIEKALTRIVDDAFAIGALQAAMGVGGWGPSAGVAHLVYETACGIHGDVPCSLDWCTRYLRQTGNLHTWLGAPLRKHLSAPPPAGVTVHELGAGVRLSIPRTDDAWRVLEQWLAPLLPTADEAQQSVRALHAR